MEERHYAAVYWEDRKATKEECIPPILDMLARLRVHDPLLSRWYLLRATREESLAAELTDATARTILEHGIVATDDERPQHGWKASLWNGEADGRSAKIELEVGAYTGASFMPTPNSCILRMPRERPASDGLLRRAPLTTLLGDLALAWNADWGLVSTDSYLMRGPPARPGHHPRVGWLTFLHGWRGRAPKVPQTHVTPVATLGYVLATQDDRFSVDDGTAVARVLDMEDALDRAKRLHPRGQPAAPEAPTKEPVPRAAPAPGSEGYGAALDAACAVDALSAGLPARRGDLGEGLLRASTALVVALASGGDGVHARAELRALLDLAERLFPDVGAEAIGRARQALERMGSH